MSALYDTDDVIRSKLPARSDRPPPTDGELVAASAIVTGAVASLRAITAAREAISPRCSSPKPINARASATLAPAKAPVLPPPR